MIMLVKYHYTVAMPNGEKIRINRMDNGWIQTYSGDGGMLRQYENWLTIAEVKEIEDSFHQPEDAT